MVGQLARVRHGTYVGPVISDVSAPGTASLRQAAAAMSSSALQRLDERLGWYRGLDPQHRSWVGLVAQTGIQSFVTWLIDPRDDLAIDADVFATAPRALTRAVSLAQTLDVIRTVVAVVEDHVRDLCHNPEDPAEVARVREAVLRYSREVAFTSASVYAEAAEIRGSWDARLEALVVDALLRGESDDALRSRIAALGWRHAASVTVMVGAAPDADDHEVAQQVRDAARASADDALVAVQGDRLVVVLGTSGRPWSAAVNLANRFGPGPVVVGPSVPELSQAGTSARIALAGLAAVRAWPTAPRPVAADDLLPERVLSGDLAARRALLDRIYRPLLATGENFAATVSCYLVNGGSLEATARELFVHPNTVRYRLRRVAEVTGWDATVGRDAYVLQIALSVGRLAERPGTGGGQPRSTDL